MLGSKCARCGRRVGAIFAKNCGTKSRPFCEPCREIELEEQSRRIAVERAQKELFKALLPTVRAEDSASEAIKSGANVNTPDAEGETPLLFLLSRAGRNMPRLARLLLDSKADPNPACGSPLCKALGLYSVVTKSVSTVTSAGDQFTRDCALERICDIANASPDGITLSAAIQQAHQNIRDLVDMLLDSGADPSAAVNGHMHGEFVSTATPLTLALQAKDHRTALRLLEKGANVNPTTPSYSSPLRLAINAGFDGIACDLVDKGAEVRESDNEDLLHLALRAEFKNLALSIVRARIERKEAGKITVSAVAAHGHLDALRELAAAGADLKGYELQELPHLPLVCAIESGRPDVVKFLLEHGVDPNTNAWFPGSCEQGSCQRKLHVLQLAVEYCQRDIFSQLIDAGADTGIECSMNLMGETQRRGPNTTNLFGYAVRVFERKRSKQDKPKGREEALMVSDIIRLLDDAGMRLPDGDCEGRRPFENWLLDTDQSERLRRPRG